MTEACHPQRYGLFSKHLIEWSRKQYKTQIHQHSLNKFSIFNMNEQNNYWDSQVERGKESPANAGDTRDTGLDPWVWKISCGRKQQPSLVFLPGKSPGQKRLLGYSPWGRKDSDTTEYKCTWLRQNSSYSSQMALDCWGLVSNVQDEIERRGISSQGIELRDSKGRKGQYLLMGMFLNSLGIVCGL